MHSSQAPVKCRATPKCLNISIVYTAIVCSSLRLWPGSLASVTISSKPKSFISGTSTWPWQGEHLFMVLGPETTWRMFFFYSFILFFFKYIYTKASHNFGFTFQFLTFNKPRESIFFLWASIFLNVRSLPPVFRAPLTWQWAVKVTSYKVNDLKIYIHKRECAISWPVSFNLCNQMAPGNSGMLFCNVKYMMIWEENRINRRK